MFTRLIAICWGLLLAPVVFSQVQNQSKQQYRLIDLREAYVIGHHYYGTSQNYLVTSNGMHRELSKELSLVWNLDLGRYMYWDNKIYGLMDREPGEFSGQFRVVGWDFQLGVRLCSYLNFEYEHFSKHVLDYKYPTEGYPSEDSFGIRLYLFRRDQPPADRSIWNVY